jgi:hypothetical protein
MFGSRKGFQARPPPPPRPRKPAPPPPPKKQLFAFDPVAAHYNALNHERRHGVTQPIVCVDLNAASERRRWRETGDLTEAAATIKTLVPEAANEGDATLERALAAHLRRRATPSLRCWDLVKARLAFQRIDCCVYCGESTRTEDEAVPCRSFKRPGGCAAEAHRRCLARAGVGLQTTRWTCGVCLEVARRRAVRTPADQRAADAQEAEAAAAAALRASGTTPSTAPGWVAELAQRGGQKSRRVAQQRRKVDARRRDAEAARDALREAQATAAQAKSLEAGVLNLAAYLAALDADDRAPAAQALITKMVTAKDEWRREVDAMLSGEAPAAANAREADDLLKQDELYLEDLERAPDDAGGWSRRFIEEPDLDAWPWSGSADVAEKMRLFARLQKQLRDTLDASLLGGPGAIASGVTCVAPKNTSDKFAYEACLWTRDPALAKIAVNMDRELLPGRVERANLSTFGEFTVDEKPPGLPDFSRPGACFVLFRRRRLPSNPSSPRVSAS